MALDTADFMTPAQALAALRDLVPVIQASSAELDRDGAFPSDALDLLAGAGVLAAFGGGSATALELMEALRLVGRANLSLGRIFEGHVNGARLVAWYGTDEQRRTLAADLASGRVFGVWNTETAPLRIEDGQLVGFKTFATGAGHIDRAIVTATTDAGRQMVLIDAAQAARCDPKSWPVSGMKATVSGTYDLSGLPASGAALLGAPGDYEREPRFSAGAWRFTAVQLGGVERILTLLRDHLVSSPGGDDPIHRARFGEALAGARSAALWVRAAAMRATRDDAGAAEIALVLMTRGVVERAGLAVMEAAHRSVGTRSYFTTNALDMACRDLGLYLRQPAPDQALDRAARAFLAADCWTDDPLW
jgi:alkylation response protein AidB-like acyl-CoA dehydrogenase